MYIPDSEMANPYARPVIADDFSNLPPAYVHTAQHDPIRDDGEIYADKPRRRKRRGLSLCRENDPRVFAGTFARPGGAAEYAKIAGWLRGHLQ